MGGDVVAPCLSLVPDEQESSDGMGEWTGTEEEGSEHYTIDIPGSGLSPAKPKMCWFT